MIWPGEELWSQLISTPGGIWAFRLDDEACVFVVKLPRALVKQLLVGRKTDLVLASVATEIGDIRVAAFELFEDEMSPVAMTSPIATTRDLDALNELLAAESVRFEFFDDASIPTLTATAVLAPRGMRMKAAVALPPEQRRINNAVLDDLETVLGGGSSLRVSDFHRLSIKFGEFQPLSTHVVGSGDFQIGVVHEGTELERAVCMLLEDVLGEGPWRGPLLSDARNKPELCDVLGLGREGAFSLVVQAKVDGVLAAKPDRTANRRLKTLSRNFERAVAQGKGAVRALRAGAKIESDGRALNIPASTRERVHVLILLSEMHGLLDWENIASMLLGASDPQTFFHVMDLAELQRLTASLADPIRATLLEPNLVNRWNAMKKHGTAFIQLRPREPT